MSIIKQLHKTGSRGNGQRVEEALISSVTLGKKTHFKPGGGGPATLHWYKNRGIFIVISPNTLTALVVEAENHDGNFGVSFL